MPFNSKTVYQEIDGCQAYKICRRSKKGVILLSKTYSMQQELLINIIPFKQLVDKLNFAFYCEMQKIFPCLIIYSWLFVAHSPQTPKVNRTLLPVSGK